MTITIFGIFFIPLTVFVAVFVPRFLLPLAIIGAVFQAASVFNITGGAFELGVPPYYFVACFIFVRSAMWAIQRRSILPPRDHPCRPAIKILLWFWTVGVISSFVLPRIFAGLNVYDPRSGIDEQFNLPTALHWTASNLAQAIYITLNVGVVLYAVWSPRVAGSYKALRVAMFIAAGAGAMQIAFALLRWPFPADLLNSNPVYGQGSEQTIGSLHRISATFTEPSYAGAFMAACLIALISTFLSGKRNGTQYLALVLVSLVLVGTTSTTGYLAAFICSIPLFVYFSPFTMRGKIRIRYASAWAVMSAGALVALLVVLVNPTALNAAINTTLQKGEELSFIHRVAADFNAVQIVGQTVGLGVGLGSNRPSSLITYLLSNVGILGMLLFAMFIRSLLRNFPPRKSDPDLHFIVWGFLTFLIAQLIAIPDLNFPLLWSFIAMLISVSAKSYQFYLGEAAPIQKRVRPMP